MYSKAHNSKNKRPQMGRSPSSSCSSTSSFSESPPLPQSAKPKTKRTSRKSNKNNSTNKEKSQLGNSPGRRSSAFRGVTRHRWTGRFEAHLWDKLSWSPIQNKKGKQVYLGAYDNEKAAARAYDLAALKYWGPDTNLNFPLDTYMKEIEEMQNVSKEEYLATLRRKSSGFSRGISKYRGVARHHHNGRWEARIGRVFGNKYLYLGTYGTQEEAAAAYDIAAIQYRGMNAVTNFDINCYLNYPQLSSSLQNQEQQQLQEEEASLFIQSPQHQELSSSLELQEQQEASMFTESQEEASSPIPTPELQEPVNDSTAVNTIEEHPWSICMDSGFDSLHVSDIALEKSSELLDLFNDTGFEENIDFLFDGSGAFDGYFVESVKERGDEYGSMDKSSSASPTTSVSYPSPISICSSEMDMLVGVL